MAPTEGNKALLAAFDRASRHLGFGPVGMDNPGPRRRRRCLLHRRQRVRRSSNGLGPGGTGGHTVNETLQVPTVAMQVARTAVLLHRITRGELR